MIIKTSKELKARYHDLESGDMFIGTLAYKHLKQSVLIDLLERGVTCLPSPLAQNLNSSKSAQALVLKDWMLPHTTVITRRIDLIETINHYKMMLTVRSDINITFYYHFIILHLVFDSGTLWKCIVI